MRLKHNKKRNIAFVYESLVRELTKAIIKKNKNRQNRIVQIIKENFNPKTILYKELSLYKTIYETKNVNLSRAEKLLAEAKTQYNKLDKHKVFEAQSALISKINKILSKDLYSNFVPNYRNIASLYSIFNVDLQPEEKVLLEEKVVEFMVLSSQEGELIPMDNLIYNSFVKKFNSEYSTSLLENQKRLLTAMISSVSDSDVEFKVYLNEEIDRIRLILTESLGDDDIKQDSEMIRKTKQVLQKLNDFSKCKIDSLVVQEILKMQELVEVIRNAG